MPGTRQKPPELLANTRGARGRGLTVRVPENRVVPRMPMAPDTWKWSRRTRAVWRQFWESPVSAAVDLNADAEPLFRWMEMIEERGRLLAEVRRDEYAPARTVMAEKETDEGRIIVLIAGAHPHLAYIKHLDKEIGRMRDHFGATPLGRFRLQLTFSEAGHSSIKLRKARDRDGRAEDAEVIDLDALAPG